MLVDITLMSRSNCYVNITFAKQKLFSEKLISLIIMKKAKYKLKRWVLKYKTSRPKEFSGKVISSLQYQVVLSISYYFAYQMCHQVFQVTTSMQ